MKSSPLSATAVLLVLTLVAGSSSVAAAAYLGATVGELQSEIDNRRLALTELKSKAVRLRGAIEKGNENASNIREKVLELDTYLSYVKGWWPRLYMADVIGSDVVGWAVDEALTNPEYSPTVRETWGGVATSNEFFEAAGVVESIYNFVTANVEYEHDYDQFGKDEVYYPPDAMLAEIKGGKTAKADCEDQAILLAVMLGRAAEDGLLDVPLEDIVVSEGVVAVPSGLRVFVLRTWRGLIPLYHRWEKAMFGHAWTEIRIPHPTDEGGKIEVALEPTHYIDNEHAPWDAWVEGSPTAKRVSEEYKIVIPELDNYEVPYPLHGYEGGHGWLEFDIWRSYGPRAVEGVRPPWKFPDANERPGMLRGDGLFEFYRILERHYGTPNPADLTYWRSHYYA